MVDTEYVEDFDIDAGAPEGADLPPAQEVAQPEGAAPSEPLEPQEGAQEEGPEGDGRPRMVPHAKFNEVYHREKEAARRASVAESRLDVLLRMMQNNGQGGQQQAPQRPVDEDPMPPEDDIVALAQWNTRQIAKMNRVQAEREQSYRREQENQALGQRVLEATRRDFSDFSATEPGLQDAYNFLAGFRTRQLMARGMSPAQAQQEFQQEELNLYYETLQKGGRPAQAILEIARASGWEPQKAPNVIPAQDIQQQAQRQRQHTSLSSAGGAASPRALDGKALAAMNEDEFAKFADQFDSLVKAG